MAVTFRPFYCLVLRFEGGECVVGMVLVVNAGTYGMALGSGLNIDVRHCSHLIAVEAIYSLHSIKEQHHKSPHQHGAHHSRYREREGLRCLMITFNYNLHGGFPRTCTKANGNRDLKAMEG
jgi:hypothetical protein